MRAPTVVLVTDPAWSLAHVERTIERAAAALPRGRLLVQLRDKTAGLDQLHASARALRRVTSQAGARLAINAPSAEQLRVATEVGADGVHVPCLTEAIEGARGALGAEAWVSVPAHTDGDVDVAVQARATAALVSPIWSTPGKGEPRGVSALEAARARSPGLYVYALGGVDPSRAAACATAGADGVAVIRALLDAADPTEAARRLGAPFEASLRERA